MESAEMTCSPPFGLAFVKKEFVLTQAPRCASIDIATWTPKPMQQNKLEAEAESLVGDGLANENDRGVRRFRAVSCIRPTVRRTHVYQIPTRRP
jgi:hypothetical protein